MKKMRTITILSLTAVILAIMTVPAMAITADGDLGDWGLSNWYKGLKYGTETGSAPLEDYWVPSSGTCQYIVEDNRDTDRTEAEAIWAAYGSTPIDGVHIQGKGSTHSDYNEGLLFVHAQPSGAELCDMEALYFDSDSNNVYFAIITSVPEDQVGDIRVVWGGHTYGIVTQGFQDGNDYKGKVYRDPTWLTTSSSYRPSYYPDCFGAIGSSEFRVNTATGTYMGDANKGSVAWANSGHPDNAHNYGPVCSWTYNHDGKNYIVEVSVPRSALDNPSYTDVADLQYNMWCANDMIGKEVTFEVPEFTTIAIPVCMIFGLFYFFRRKRQNE